MEKLYCVVLLCPLSPLLFEDEERPEQHIKKKKGEETVSRHPDCHAGF